MRALISAISLIFLWHVPGPGADFWQKKPFPDWTPNDLQVLLTDSPWSRRVLLSLESLGGGPSPAGEPAARSKASCVKCPAGPVFAAESGGAPRMGAPVAVVVRWLSALPVRQALARVRFGAEVTASADASELLNREPEFYVVGISRVPFARMPEDLAELKAGTCLKLRTGPPIPVSNVESRREADIVNLVLFFPKGKDRGRVITLDDREVEVSVKAAALQLSRKFKLAAMVYRGKLEL